MAFRVGDLGWPQVIVQLKNRDADVVQRGELDLRARPEMVLRRVNGGVDAVIVDLYAVFLRSPRVQGQGQANHQADQREQDSRQRDEAALEKNVPEVYVDACFLKLLKLHCKLMFKRR